ncbi:MAG: hypothetical protein ABFD07_18205 [Methanobacterium sp.]
MFRRNAMDVDVIYRQQKICEKFGAVFCAAPNSLKLGISLNVRDHIYPINGLRHQAKGDTTGWYVWAGEGEPSTEIDFFKPLHIIHLNEWCPEIIPYLGLPPGWRFLITPNYEDVWFDEYLQRNGQ